MDGPVNIIVGSVRTQGCTDDGEGHGEGASGDVRGGGRAGRRGAGGGGDGDVWQSEVGVGRGVDAALQRGEADGVRGSDHRRGTAVGVVLLEPAGAAGMLLPVRAQPGVRSVYWQPHRPQGHRRLPRRRSELLARRPTAGTSRMCDCI